MVEFNWGKKRIYMKAQEIEYALFEDEFWHVSQLMDKTGNYIRDYQIEMKIASQAGRLICPECGNHLELCAGEIRYPYLRHWKGESCVEKYFGNKAERINAKAELIKIAKWSFPGAKISIDKKEHMYPVDIYVEHKAKMYGISYLSSAKKLEEWNNLYQYQEHRGLHMIWVLNRNNFRADTTSAFEYLVSSNQGYVLLIDIPEKLVTVKKPYKDPETGSDHTFTKWYQLNKLNIMPDSSFFRSFNKDYEKWIERKKLEWEKLQKERIREAQEAEQREKELREKRSKSYAEFEKRQKGKVRRIPLRNPILEDEVQIPELNENWIIPEFVYNNQKSGVTLKSAAHYNREIYMGKRREKFSKACNQEELDTLINDTIKCLENDCRAYSWANRR